MVVSFYVQDLAARGLGMGRSVSVVPLSHPVALEVPYGRALLVSNKVYMHRICTFRDASAHGVRLFAGWRSFHRPCASGRCLLPAKYANGVHRELAPTGCSIKIPLEEACEKQCRGQLVKRRDGFVSIVSLVFVRLGASFCRTYVVRLVYGHVTSALDGRACCTSRPRPVGSPWLALHPAAPEKPTAVEMHRLPQRPTAIHLVAFNPCRASRPPSFLSAALHRIVQSLRSNLLSHHLTQVPIHKPRKPPSPPPPSN